LFIGFHIKGGDLGFLKVLMYYPNVDKVGRLPYGMTRVGIQTVGSNRSIIKPSLEERIGRGIALFSVVTSRKEPSLSTDAMKDKIKKFLDKAVQGYCREPVNVNYNVSSDGEGKWIHAAALVYEIYKL
jgi:hypothetical protein